MIVAAEFPRIIGSSTARPLNSYRPSKAALILAAIAFALMVFGIALNYFAGGSVRYWQIAFALCLLAFLVWFSRPRPRDE